ncbi:hypothetical protein LguiB_011229 [Lonicera macranthoides]
MICQNTKPLTSTVSNALIACSNVSALKEGIQIHAYSIKMNMGEDEVISSSFIGMYAKCGDLGSAQKISDKPSSNLIGCRWCPGGELFNEMPERNIISWNAMLVGYTWCLPWEEALDFVLLMQRETREIDYVTIGLILNVCTLCLSDVELGKQVHGFAYRRHFYSNLFVGNALLRMYGKCGNLRSAQLWFSEMSRLRDKVSWNAVTLDPV